MQFKVITEDTFKIECDAIVVDIYEKSDKTASVAAADAALDGAIGQLIESGEIKGKLGEVTLIHTLSKMKAQRLAVLGLGKKEDLTIDKVRGAVAGACRRLRKAGVKKVATVVLGTDADLNASEVAQATTEGAILGLYQFRKHISKEPDNPGIDEITIVASDKGQVADMQKAVETGVIMAEAGCTARDMINEPGNQMTPSDMAAMALKVASDTGIEVTVYDKDWMEEMGMGGLLGVARGSAQPPKFIVLKYNGGGGKNVGLVGKGLTFDSGGISLKPSEKMEEMKGDMSGGAAVIAAMGAIARLKPKINVTGLVPATENMPGGAAQKPGDVLTPMNGKTVEVINTDAEGRLILADALCYANELKLAPVVDIATLTGACMITFGTICSGVFANNQDAADSLLKASKATGEKMWQLPMYDEYKEMIKSNVADIKNVGSRWGGAITAAQFLAEFVGDTPWVHIDIAGTFHVEKDDGYLVKGATGVSTRTLIEMVLSLA